MEFLQVNIEELDKWRNMEKNVPSSLHVVKAYDIRLHTLDTNECQELDSMFEEKATQSLAWMMNVYDNLVYDVQRYLQWPDINFKDEHPISYSFFQELEDKYEMNKEEV